MLISEIAVLKCYLSILVKFSSYFQSHQAPETVLISKICLTTIIYSFMCLPVKKILKTDLLKIEDYLNI